MAKARDIKKENNSIICVIGDGALTGGMALEALNDAGSSDTKLTVILNDTKYQSVKNVIKFNPVHLKYCILYLIIYYI